ncbi:phosphoribosylglycinamide formyltransferase [Leucobacter aridicollis]|uniref:Phosphoribosylglycinamide formyltransferase n=1 Tax=Leucobacter aridicollis TaxID=283878 RepID=A0A852R5N6_9MICO|nr:phosphoribosylglycinamide formyltransferase [Leucobacter aridicollis]MBL3682810.1 phosphoribosylglycinamide formyltransferase [Leucobacter aridicollis]NYD26248.1 phosphoribosylglycinamide formyltransferase-1 [Leucobacter aridicollis]
MLRLAVLISGGGSNLQALIEATKDPDFPAEIVCVGADTDAAGLAHAEAAAIPNFVVRPADYASRADWGAAFAAEIQSHDVDLVVSAGLMRILPVGFVAAFSPRLINTHPALLPLFPGAHAVRDALAAGATETGVTVHIIDEGVDTGPVLRQATVAVRDGEREADLHERIKQEERPLLIRTVREIADGTLDLAAVASAARAQ